MGSDLSDKRPPTPYTGNKSEGGVGEDENYERIEREAIRAESDVGEPAATLLEDL